MGIPKKGSGRSKKYDFSGLLDSYDPAVFRSRMKKKRASIKRCAYRFARLNNIEVTTREYGDTVEVWRV